MYVTSDSKCNVNFHLVIFKAAFSNLSAGTTYVLPTNVATALSFPYSVQRRIYNQPAFTYSKLTIEILEQGGKYVLKVNLKDSRTTPLASFWCLYC